MILFFTTLDGSLPDRNSYLYKGVLKIDSSVTLKAMAYRNNQMSQVSSLKVDCNKATFKPVTLPFRVKPHACIWWSFNASGWHYRFYAS